jgi:hypothetical protein
MSSWIERTGQRWKLFVFLGLILPSGLAIGCLFFVPASALPGRGTALRIWLVAISVAALTWFWVSLRCRTCRKSIGWWAFSTSNGVARLLGLDRCPICHDEGQLSR